MAYEIIESKSYAFAKRIVKLHKYLRKEQNHYGLGNQVLRSGTSIGANVNEAVYSQSVLDNISKLSIALKEANETRYWLRLLTDTGYITVEEGNSLLTDCTELIKILTAIVRSLKTNS